MFTPFSQFPNIICTTSTKSDGSMKDRSGFKIDTITTFVTKLHVNPEQMIWMKQVHSGKINTIHDTKTKIIADVDGLITDKKDIFLCVVTADCLPIVFFDPKKNVIAAVHAGYKGLLQHIIENTIEKMKTEFGVLVEDVFVNIGPGIGVCCYNVDSDRATLFKDLLPDHPEIINMQGEDLFLDLLQVAEVVLRASGIITSQISKNTVCTKDAKDTYFSYRRDCGDDFGQIVTLIGMI